MNDDEDTGEVVILQVVEPDDDSDQENYYSVDSEETLAAVFRIFKKHYKDIFHFMDE